MWRRGRRWNNSGSGNYRRNNWGNKTTWRAPSTPPTQHSQAERDAWVDADLSIASQLSGGDEDADHVLLGTVRGGVVGLQYYHGEVGCLHLWFFRSCQVGNNK